MTSKELVTGINLKRAHAMYMVSIAPKWSYSFFFAPFHQLSSLQIVGIDEDFLSESVIVCSLD